MTSPCTIRTTEQLFWQNCFAAHPVCVVNLASVPLWRFDSLSQPIRALILRKFSLQANHMGNSAPSFLAALCASMQKEKFGTPMLMGASDLQFWFTASDYYHAHVTALRSVMLLNQLQHPQVNEAAAAKALREMEDVCENAALDQSARAIAAAAEKRSIPWFRMSPSMRDIQLGHGNTQQRMRETVSSAESTIAVSYSRDKVLTCQMLQVLGLPVGRFALAADVRQAVEAARMVGFPLVVKPVHGRKGQDVIIGLNTPEGVQKAAQQLLQKWPQIILQSFLPGDDHRLLVVAGKMVAAARRDPAAVTGDGKHTIAQLIDIANSDPRRGEKFYRIMNLITVDQELQRVLAGQKLTLSDTPPAGKQVRLRLTANISTGGTATDVTRIVHPDNVMAAERAASALGLKVAGVDFLIPDISRSWKEVGGGICEVNASPGVRSHMMSNPKCDVMKPILDTVFPPGNNGRIPTALIARAKESAAAAQVLSCILQEAGHTAGCVSADGITINGTMAAKHISHEVNNAVFLLRDPTVSAAAIEINHTACLKSGIYPEQCDAVAMLEMEEDPASLKLLRKIIQSAQKRIFNADDPACLEMAREYPAQDVILFSVEPSAKLLKTILNAGGTMVLVEKPAIIVRHGKHSLTLVKKITKDSLSASLAAAAVAHGLGLAPEAITAGIKQWNKSRGD